MTRRTRGATPGRASTWLAALACLLVTLTGCAGPTFSSLPLPGSGVSGRTITVTADFADALNLAQGAIVKVNGIDSGRVRDVSAHDFRARVRMQIKAAAQLRRGATARLRYTTPLGELFVDISNPGRGRLLPSGSTLPRRSTSTAPTVEDALAESSLLINGGGLGQLETITTELDKALQGRTGTVRDLLARADTALAALNASSKDIDRTLRALDGVSGMLDRRRDTIHAALRDLRPASRVIRANLSAITDLLADLRDFASTANSVVGETRDQVLALVRKAGPILQEMASTRSVLPQTLRALVALAEGLDRVVPGDYLNLGTRLRLDKTVLGTHTPIGPDNVKQLGHDIAQNLVQGVLGQLLSGLSGPGSRGGSR